MNPTIETALAFILFLPVFAIIGALYSLFPRNPRGIARRLGDLAVLMLATVLSVFAMRWGFHAAAGVAGALWKQIVATLLAYGVFLAVVCLALPLRAWWWRRGKRSVDSTTMVTLSFGARLDNLT
jgi:TRAP-type C4-dicarboxylate transport system permease small subunit